MRRGTVQVGSHFGPAAPLAQSKGLEKNKKLLDDVEKLEEDS